MTAIRSGVDEASSKASAVPGSAPAVPAGTDFVRAIVMEDNLTGKYGGRVHTRFPPEPNGYLHIGHAKAICIDFGVAREFGGLCNLRMDDTNPSKEDVEYVDSIQEDVRWLGFEWFGPVRYASDYFAACYDYAELLIQAGKAYVCDLSQDEIRGYRGTLTEPGKESPYRSRSVAENLDLFRRMSAGEFPDGTRVLRAKIDMNSPNIHMRDPVIYRNLHASHHRTGDAWCLYPTYDYAHPIEDALEGITHSLCTLEFEIHRPLYDWVLEQIPEYFASAQKKYSGLDLESPMRPHQWEFARLSLTHTVMSKRKLLELVRDGCVSGWDDPRMPTVCGLRRRGYTPESIRTFCERIGVTKYNSLTDMAFLEHCLREDLNQTSPRAMAVLHPLRVIIDNYPDGQTEELDAVNNPEAPAMGSRKVPFSKVLYIEQDDFRETPPPKYYRLAPGAEVRLRYAYLVKCVGVTTDPSTGRVNEVHCTYDPQSRGGTTPDGRKVKGTIHWVSAAHAVEAEVRLYEHLFLDEDPAALPEGVDWKTRLNPASLQVVKGCRLEPSLSAAVPGSRYQFERVGYFCADRSDSGAGRLVFNRTVSLKDSWAKLDKTQRKQYHKTRSGHGAWGAFSTGVRHDCTGSLCAITDWAGPHRQYPYGHL